MSGADSSFWRLTRRAAQWCWGFVIQLWVQACRSWLALPLLVSRIRADHHDPPMPTDHPALIANGLDARVHLHGLSILFLSRWSSVLLLTRASARHLYR